MEFAQRCARLASIAILAVVFSCLSSNFAIAKARAGSQLPDLQHASQSPMTSSPGLWHVVDSATDPAQRPAILAGSRSLWCGKYNPCWVDSVGYPNLMYEVLYLDTGAHTSSYTLNVKMRFSAELNYDAMYLIGGGGGATDPLGNDRGSFDTVMSLGASGNSRLLATWTGSILSSSASTSINTLPGPVAITGSNVGQPDSLTASIQIASGHRALYFIFRSDESYSSQDGFWPFGTGAVLDNLVTSDNGAIYTDASPSGGTDSFGGSVIIGTGAAPIVSSRGIPIVPNSPPEILAPSNQTWTEGDDITLTASAGDSQGNPICMYSFGYPSGLVFTPINGYPAFGTVDGTLQCAAAGSPYTITWCATTSPYYYETTATTMLTVLPNPHAPAVSAPASVSRSVGSTLIIPIAASDPDGDAITDLTADLSNLPPADVGGGNPTASFSAEPGDHAGSLTWNLHPGDEGDYRVRFSAFNTLAGCVLTRIHVAAANITGVALGDPAPANVYLDQNRPNPFNPETSIQFHLPREARVVLEVFDIRGGRVAKLLDRVLPAGPHDTSWDGRDGRGRAMPSGVYLCRVQSEGLSLSRRMILLR